MDIIQIIAKHSEAANTIIELGGDYKRLLYKGEDLEKIIKAVLEEYTNRIVENVLLRQTNYKGSWTSEGSISLDDYTDITVDKESITSQLEPFIKSLL